MGLLAALTRGLLAVPAVMYCGVQKVHESAYRNGILKVHKATIPVISVGNLLLGGSGKTPFVIYLADLLHRYGMRPAVVSRGYRGTYKADYLVVGDGSKNQPLVEPVECGDEPYLISSRLPHIPVLVGRKRIHPVIYANKLFSCNVVVLDDGFQHMQLARDADIVLLNGSEDAMFPLGTLREPLSALRRADLVVITGRDTHISDVVAPFLLDLPSFRCGHIPTELIGLKKWKHSDDLKGQNVILASGIAHPHRFLETARNIGWNVKRHFEFPDHHRLTDGELQDMLAQAGELPIIFTEKDWVKLPEWLRGSGQTGALRIEVEMHNDTMLLEALQKIVGPSLSIPEGTNLTNES